MPYVFVGDDFLIIFRQLNFNFRKPSFTLRWRSEANALSERNAATSAPKKPRASSNRKPRPFMSGSPEHSSGCRPQVNDANGAVLFPGYRRDSADQPILRRQIADQQRPPALQRRRLACDGATCSWLGVPECNPWTIAARTVG
ncbi:hypothetical protein ACLKA7_000843 [Drosophila subpalustris]